MTRVPQFGSFVLDGWTIILADGPIGQTSLRIDTDEPTADDWLRLMARHAQEERAAERGV